MRHLYLLLFIIIFLNTTISQNIPRISPPGTEAVWDLQIFFPLTSLISGSAYGAEFDGNYFYGTWLPDTKIQKYSSTGNFIEQFTISGVSGIRDLAFDGVYMYGGKQTAMVYKMDFINKTLVDSFSTPVPVRHIAYDSDNDAFWIGDFSTAIYLVDRGGIILSAIPVLTSLFICGSAWDNITPGGPFLWLFDESGIIRQMKVPEGIITGVSFDVTSDFEFGGAGGLFATADLVPGTFSLGGLVTTIPTYFVYEIASFAPPCPVNSAINPVPADRVMNLPIQLTHLSWTNPSGSGAALMNDVYFGTNPASLNLIHSGSLVNSVNIPLPLQFATTYYWRVIEKNDTCSGESTLWRFTTKSFSVCDFFDTFNWTTLGPLGYTNWGNHLTNYAGGSPPELRFSWTPSFIGESKLISQDFFPPGHQELRFRFFIDIYSSPSGVFKIGYTTDGGNTVSNIWTLSDPAGNVGPEYVITDFISPGICQIVISYEGDTYNINYWYLDDLCIWAWWPVELKSFTALPGQNEVLLSWITASETNNSGFNIERSSNNTDFNPIAFVEGSGTTTLENAYHYTDKDLDPGKYYYRLKQIDLNGSYEYSEIAEVDLTIPVSFKLEQNYPNPFNPSTTIKYQIPEAGFVMLKVYDVLGNQVAVLVNEHQNIGSYTTEFDAQNIAGGVYLCRLQFNSFISTKKMILVK